MGDEVDEEGQPTAGQVRGWASSKAAILAFVDVQEELAKDVLPFYEQAQELAKAVAQKALAQPDSPTSFVVPSLVTRSMRLSTIGLLAALGGYGELVPAVGRTLFEIWLRLAQIRQDPIAASLGYLIGASREELRVLESSLRGLGSVGLPTNVQESEFAQHLKNRIEAIRARLRTQQERARELGLNATRVETDYGKLNVKRACRRLGVSDDAYVSFFGFMSDYIHERGLAAYEYVVDTEHNRQFVAAPASSYAGYPAEVIEAVLVVLAGAAGAIGESDLELRARDASQKAQATFQPFAPSSHA